MSRRHLSRRLLLAFASALVGLALTACGDDIEADPNVSTCPAPRPAAIAPLPATSVVGASWSGELVIDVSECEPKRYHAALQLGSAWTRIEPSADGKDCYAWLGGETEDPLYNGSPSQYCSFPRTCSPSKIRLGAGRGGPARMSSPACTP